MKSIMVIAGFVVACAASQYAGLAAADESRMSGSNEKSNPWRWTGGEDARVAKNWVADDKKRLEGSEAGPATANPSEWSFMSWRGGEWKFLNIFHPG